jgi:hypothetical protein
VSKDGYKKYKLVVELKSSIYDGNPQKNNRENQDKYCLATPSVFLLDVVLAIRNLTN